jgi:hypothetical protein
MKNESERGVNLGGIETDATLWIMIPQLLFSIVFSSVLLLFAFWLEFGELAAFAYGFIVFLAAFQILMVMGFRFRNRTDYQVEGPASLGILDKVGGLWLIACAFGAFLGWMSGGVAAWVFPAYKTAFYYLAAFFSIVLPVTTMLPNLRYLSGKAMMLQIPLLTLVTILPMLVGMYYLSRLL